MAAPAPSATHWRLPRWAGVTLAVAIAWLYLLALFSNAVLARLTSPCGRLQHIGPTSESLADAHVRLDLPDGRTWSTLTADLTLQKNEAVSVIVDRAGNDYSFVRVSTLDRMESGLFTVRNHAIVERHPLAEPAIQPRRLTLQRDAQGVQLRFDEGVWQRLGSSHPGTLEVVMFPPPSRELHDRFRLNDVQLVGGGVLPASHIEDIARSPPILALIALVLILLTHRRLTRLIARVAPFQSANDHASLLACGLSAVLMLVALCLIPKTALLPAFTSRERLVYREFVTLMVGLWVGFVALRDRRLRTTPRQKLDHPASVPALFLATCFAGLILFVAVNAFIMRVVDPDELARTEPDSTLRVAVLGGSTTRGFPFADEWQGSYPFLMQKLLRDERHLPAAVWNLGVDSVGLDFIVSLLRKHVATLKPTTVIINSVVNNALGAPPKYEGFREQLSAAVDAAKKIAQHVILVKEPALEPIYGSGRWSTVAPLYPIVDEAAHPPDVVVIDPLPLFAAHRDEFLFMDDVHMTPYAHRLLSDLLSAEIAREAGATRPPAPELRQ